jgi:diketogulonate reductase-like aldo/keto reductase
MDIERTVTLNNGDAMPRLGLGLWETPAGNDTRNAVRWALEAGYRHLDTARAYGNEIDVGEALRASGVPRKDVWVTTKLYNNDQGYEPALRACKESLRRLGLDYVDQYLIHWPVPVKRLESWRALVKLQRDGFCRTIGVSNFQVRHLEELMRSTETKPQLNQIEIHPFLQQNAVRAWCTDRDIAIAAYSPLVRGSRFKHPVIREVATRVDRSPAQVLVRWSLQKGHVVLPKSTKRERIVQNAAVWDWELGDSEVAMLDQLDEALHTCWDPTDVP